MAKQAATPWGGAKLVDELTLPQRAGEKRFASVVQLLEGKVRDGQHVLVDYDRNAGKLVFNPQSSPVPAQTTTAKV